MPQITAEAVKKLRSRTGLPMMDCKKALSEADGDEEAAIDLLRTKGQQVMEKRADRETSFGRFGLYCGADKTSGAIVELKCESAPVAGNDEFIQLANDMAEVYALDSAISSVDELLSKPSPSKDGMTLSEQKDDMFNRIREVFNVGRMERFEGATGGYTHNAGTVSGVLVAVEGGSDELAKDVSMHIAAMRPSALSTDELDPAMIERERNVLKEAALQEGKPESIVDKMVEGRMRNFFAEKVLLEQPFVKDDKQTVGNYAKGQGMTINKYVHWELGVEA